MRIREFLKMPEFAGFRLVAGADGLDREADMTILVDFEFCKGIDFRREVLLGGGSIAMSSLLYAREDPELLCDSIEKLDELGVACLAYKPIFYGALPERAVRYADEHGFPLFMITDDTFFEDIVLAVRKAVGKDLTESEIEQGLERLIAGELSAQEEKRLRNTIAGRLSGYVQAVCFSQQKDGAAGESLSADLARYEKRLLQDRKLTGRVSLCRFRSGGILLLGRKDGDAEGMRVFLEDVLLRLGLSEDMNAAGTSEVLPLDTAFDTAVREAFYAHRAAVLKGTKGERYENLGVMRFLAPEASSKTLYAGVCQYLKPLLKDGKAADRESLYETARAVVLAEGDLDRAAEKLFCHKNTVRYRMDKIHKLLDPASSNQAFYDSLRVAVMTLLLRDDGREE
ncbi:MAG: PucR family transcriptional regulator [Clostridiales bacterium]|nr:PucR family transcriptional regulator [Clostridiales bacterium]